jgi:O-antigen ligase
VTKVLLSLWLLSLGVDWPALPGNGRVADLLFFPAAAAVLSTGRGGLRARALDVAVGAYAVAGGIGLLASTDRAASLIELARHGYLALSYLVIAIAIVRGHAAVVSSGLAGMGLALAVPAVCFAVVFAFHPFQAPMIGEVMAVPYAGDVLRLRGFTASPTMLACVLTIALPFAAAQWASAENSVARRRWLAGIISMSAALALTFSHAWAGAALAVTIALWPRLADRAAVRVAGVASIALLTLAFNASLIASVRSVSAASAASTQHTPYPYGVGDGRVNIGSYTVDYTMMSYFRIKQLAWEAFASKPLTGVGLDRFHDVTTAAYNDGRLPHVYRVVDPHSSLLGRLAETGVLGGVSLLALWAALFGTGLRLASARNAGELPVARAALAGLAGLLLVSINVDIMNFRFFWAVAGILRGLQEIEAAGAPA